MARKKKEVEAAEEVKTQIEPKEEKVTDIAYRVTLSDPRSFLNIRKRPDIDSEVIGRLDHGAEIMADAPQGDWVKYNGGYVLLAKLEAI